MKMNLRIFDDDTEPHPGIIGMNCNLTQVLKQIGRKLWQLAQFCKKSHHIKACKELRYQNRCFSRDTLNSLLRGSLNFAYHNISGSPCLSSFRTLEITK